MSDRRFSNKKLFIRSSSAVLKNDPSASARSKSLIDSPSVRQNRSASIIALEELVQCGVCLDKFVAPKMLPCQHTFCFDCLKSLVMTNIAKKIGKGTGALTQANIQATIANTTTEIRCPTCQSPTEIPKGIEGLQNLPNNLYIDNLLRVLGDNGNSMAVTPTRSSPELRCVKCQTVCEFGKESCRHCRQLFCQICWAEHLSTLKTNLSTLVEQLKESETLLGHRLQEYHEYCDKLRVTVEKSAQEIMTEIKAKEEANLKELDNIKNHEKDIATTLNKRIVDMKKEIEQLKFEGISNDKQKVETFLNYHSETSKILNEVSQVGDVRLVFDPQTFKIKCNNELFERTVSGEEGDVTDSKNISNSLENIDSMNTYYISRKFHPKLVWTKCPRPAGVAIPPWAPNLLYIAATDSKVVLIMDREMSKIIGKLSATEMICPESLAFSKDSYEIYVTDKWKHCIHVFSSEGDYLRTLCSLGSGCGELRSPEAIAVNSRNELIVCDVGNDRVLVLDPVDGQHIFTFGKIGNCTELQAPTGVAVFEDKVIIADNGNHRIKVFSTDGKKLFEFGSYGTDKGQFRTTKAVACDPLGFILVADAGNARIQVFRPDGSLIRVLGSYGESSGKFAWISGLTVTPQMDIIVTDNKNRRLQIF